MPASPPHSSKKITHTCIFPQGDWRRWFYLHAAASPVLPCNAQQHLLADCVISAGNTSSDMAVADREDACQGSEPNPSWCFVLPVTCRDTCYFLTTCHRGDCFCAAAVKKFLIPFILFNKNGEVCSSFPSVHRCDLWPAVHCRKTNSATITYPVYHTVLWRCSMTSCLPVLQVHLRREYGTLMMLYDAFYGFIMEFPVCFGTLLIVWY